ncbi:hypothetical protein MBANPS3_012492 [Mucor bainieri]
MNDHIRLTPAESAIFNRRNRSNTFRRLTTLRTENRDQLREFVKTHQLANSRRAPVDAEEEEGGYSDSSSDDEFLEGEQHESDFASDELEMPDDDDDDENEDEHYED